MLEVALSSDELGKKLARRIDNDLLTKQRRGVSAKEDFDIKNVLVLEFVGKNGVPAKTLVESEIDENDYKDAISLISRLYKKAELVHADFSEYNIFKTENGLILFDLGSAVDIRHRNAKEFLQRDIKNISRFFVKRGLTVEHPSDIMARITN